MRALYHALLVTTLVFLVAIIVAALAAGPEWTLANRHSLLATSLGLGAAVGIRTRRA